MLQHLKSIFGSPMSSQRTRPLALLATVFIYIFILPIFSTALGNILTIILILLILMQSAFVLGERRSKFLVLVFLLLAIEAITQFANMAFLNNLSKLTTNLFFIYVVFRLISEIIKTKEVAGITIIEAVNGYLLLGIAYAGFISFVSENNPEAFSHAFSSLNEIKYYTFVTLTTLGYGDITPVSQVARSLSLIIAISGQFYVGVIVAILVGKYASK